MRRDFLPAVQGFVARSSIGTSTLRGQGAGTAAAVREFLCEMPLAPFAVASPHLFVPRLDAATDDLEHAMPARSRSWGAARKALNIFLRNALYNGYLRDRFRLGQAELLLEIPLDSIVAERLRVPSYGRDLPRWKGVRHLEPDVSTAYQLVAERAGRRAKVPRVHLDTYWWGGDRIDHVL